MLLHNCHEEVEDGKRVIYVRAKACEEAKIEICLNAPCCDKCRSLANSSKFVRKLTDWVYHHALVTLLYAQTAQNDRLHATVIQSMRAAS